MLMLQRHAESRSCAANYSFTNQRSRTFLARLIPAGMAALIVGLVYGTARANTITVYSLIDPGTAGTCSLRDAITAANTKKAVHACAKGNGTDTIVFNAGLSGTIALGSTLPPIVNTLTISGTQVSPPAIIISGQNQYEILVVNSGATLNLNYLTLTEGSAVDGGGIFNAGTLDVANSTISDNSSTDNTNGGGGIFSQGTLNVANCTFSSNSGFNDAGGIMNFSGTATVINSTFYGNTANDGGGGILNFLGGMTVVNSTFADNVAGFSGGGAIFNDNSLDLEGTIVASSTAGNCAGFAINDEGYNLSDDGTCGFTAIGSKNNVANLDLGGLQFNGGPTETISIDSGSAAYDLIPVADCTYQNINPCTNPPAASASGPLVCDQRGVIRPQTTNCDAGAFELQETSDFADFGTGLIVFPKQFAAGGSFNLPGDADFGAINPTNQPVTITIFSAGSLTVLPFGPLGVTIPPGSFTLVGGQYKYSGTIGGVKYGVTIGVPNSSGVYQFTAAVFGVDVAGLSNPVSVTLQIGPYIGTDDDVAAAIL